MARNNRQSADMMSTMGNTRPSARNNMPAQLSPSVSRSHKRFARVLVFISPFFLHPKNPFYSII